MPSRHRQHPPLCTLHKVGVALAVLFLWHGASVAATPTRIESGEALNTLVELYTSEGCSSCPPADRWLSGLREDPRLWRSIVPVAFHVDYWDYLGWEDLLASPAHTARQRVYAKGGHVSQVYTPGFVVAGREWRGWFGRDALPSQSVPAIGRLQLELFDRTRASLNFSPVQSLGDDLRYTVALLGFDVHTDVRRGENAGKALRHDFVVLAAQAGPLPRTGSSYRAEVSLPVGRQRAPRYGVAVWVSRASDPAPLQAAGGWIPATIVSSDESAPRAH